MTLSLQLVTPAEIESTLNQIWESLETKNVNRACLFNMIFYTEKNHRSTYIGQLAQKMIEKFPSRIIFISVDKTSKEDFLKTEVSILSSKGHDIACDYIQIETSGSSEERIPFLLLSHILPDLPVYLLWAENPSLENPLRNQLEAFVNRVIFDSESTDNLSEFASTLLKQRCEVADLNWARIEDWKEMLTAAFYAKEHLEQVRSAQTITITYNSKPSSSFCRTNIQAIYLQAWLASALDFKLQSTSDCCLCYQTKEGDLKVILEPMEDPTLPPGLILSVDLITKNKEHYCFIRSKTLLHQITFTHSTANQCSIPCQYLFPKAESGHALVKEICHRGTSEHFLNVLKLIKTAGIQAC